VPFLKSMLLLLPLMASDRLCEGTGFGLKPYPPQNAYLFAFGKSLL
jgi:hypothetical protein